MKTKDKNLAISTPPFFPHFCQLKTSEITSLLILKLLFSLFGEISPVKKNAGPTWTSVFSISQSCDDPLKDLARFGNMLNMKVVFFLNRSIFSATLLEPPTCV